MGYKRGFSPDSCCVQTVWSPGIRALRTDASWDSLIKVQIRKLAKPFPQRLPGPPHLFESISSLLGYRLSIGRAEPARMPHVYRFEQKAGSRGQFGPAVLLHQGVEGSSAGTFTHASVSLSPTLVKGRTTWISCLTPPQPKCLSRRHGTSHRAKTNLVAITVPIQQVPCGARPCQGWWCESGL